MEGWMDGWRNRKMDRWMDGRMDEGWLEHKNKWIAEGWEW